MFLFSSVFVNLLLILITLIILYVKYVYSYWRRRGIPYLSPTFPFGNFGKNFRQKCCLFEQLDEFYRSTDKPFIGTFVLMNPTLIVRDPEYIRNILIRDFQHFTDRGVYIDEENDPISAHLLTLPGEKWRSHRSKLTPTFTSGKMRAIFTTLLDCKNPLQRFIEKASKTNETVEIREITTCFTTNVIASVAFGIEIDCLADPDTPFRKYGRKFFEFNLTNAIRFLCFKISPRTLKWSGLRFMDREVENFFFNMVRETLELREKNNIVRKDFFQLLVQLRNSGNVQEDGEWHTKIASAKTMTIEEIVAESFIFYVAGFETSATAMAYCLYELAKNTKLLHKVQREIDTVLSRHNGELTYESINELKYLECCVDGLFEIYFILSHSVLNFIDFNFKVGIFICSFYLKKNKFKMLSF